MSIKVTVLGSGTMVPTKQRNPAGFFVEAAGKKILLDCGHGIIRRMIDYEIDLQSLDAVFISHFHTDHFSDAFSLVHTRFVDDMYHKREHKPLLFIGPRTLQKRYNAWRKIFWLEPNEHYPLTFREGSQRLKIGQIKIETFCVQHVPWFQSVGIRLFYKNKLLVYTGDIGSKHNIEDLKKRVRGADLLITEASHEFPTPTHYSFGQVKELANQARVKKVLVVHMPPHHVRRVKYLTKHDSKFIPAFDGLNILV